MNPLLETYRDRTGYIAYVVQDRKKEIEPHFTTSADELYNLMNTYGLTHNNWVSLGTFNTPRRSSLNISEMTKLAIDIDCRMTGLTEQESQELAIAILEIDTMPKPSIIEFTGHGVQVFYNLRGATDSTLWKQFEKALVIQYEKELDIIQETTLTSLSNLLEIKGAHIDKQCSDLSRVMRVPETMNIKRDKAKGYNEDVLSKVIYSSDNIYTLEDFSKYEPFKDLERLDYEKAINCTEKELKTADKKEMPYLLETRIRARLEDLKDLIRDRNGQRWYTGYRNTLMSIYTSTLACLGYSKEEIQAEADELNAVFFEPLSETELKGIVRSATGLKVRVKDDKYILKKTYYRYRTTTILEKLGITEQEQEKLRVLVSGKIRSRRNWAKHGAKYNAKRRTEYAMKSEAKQKREQRNQAIVELSTLGNSTREIANIIGVSNATVSRVLKACKK